MTGCVDKYSVKGSSKPRWRYRIYAGKNPEGVKQYPSAGGFETQKEAADAMRQRINELERHAGRTPKAKVTFGEHLRWWLEHHAPLRCTPKTLERYTQLAAYILTDSDGKDTALARTMIQDVTSAQLETVLYDLLRAPATRRKHLSAKTVRHVAGVINVVLNKAFKLDYILVNPMLRVELPVVEEVEARSLTPEEIEALLGVCLDDWTHPFIQVALATGCRRGELCAVEWTDIDFLNSIVTISKSLEQTKKLGLRVKRPKSGKTRKFHLPQSAIAALKFQREKQAEAKRMFGADYKDLKLVFSQPDGSYLNPALVSQTLVRRMRKAGIMDASLHTLRHSHGSLLLRKLVSLPTVSTRLGHANVNITARIYAHALPADDQPAANTWDEVMKNKPQ